MKYTNFFLLILALALFSACGEPTPISKDAVNAPEANASPQKQTLSETERPQKIKDMMKARGEQDDAKPTLKFIEPKDGAIPTNSTVKVKLELGGELKGYKPMKDPETGMGNHIHIILDNQPYEAYYHLEKEFELKNVSDGEHTLRVFPSRPWHESYKNEGAFQTVKFTVKNGAADNSKPTTTNSGEKLADANQAPAAEGKEMKESVAGAVDLTKPLLTYSRPKGEYKGADTEAIMIDFWLTNVKLTGDGGAYKVRYSVDGGEAKMLENWQPIWLAGWTAGKHDVKLELVDKDGKPVENGDYNTTIREITIVK